LDGRY